MRSISLHSRRKLKPIDAQRFVNAKPALFAELALVVCSTGMLPQKELHECWQMAVAVHRAFPDTLRIADLAAGHGLLAWIFVLLARRQDVPLPRTAIAVDITKPKSAGILAAAITAHWPELLGTVHYVEGSIDAVVAEDGPETLFVANHACGSLSDRVLLSAIASRSPMAIMPCCHSLRKQQESLAALGAGSGLLLPGSEQAIDSFRIDVLVSLGYGIREDSIQSEITSFNRIIMGHPQKSPEGTAREIPSLAIKRSGEIRAFESVPTLNVADISTAETLSQRPSREWLRSFDLSFWVTDEAAGQGLSETLADVLQRMDPDQTARLTLRDRYSDPQTQQPALTYRIELRSSSTPISRDDALAFRKKILAQRFPPGVTLR